MLPEHLTRAVDDFFSAHSPDGRRVLDVGCGDGSLRDHMEERHPGFLSYLGVDEADAVATARRRRPDLHRDFAVRDVTTVPFPPETFDLVLALRGGPPIETLAAMASAAALRVDTSGYVEVLSHSV